METVIYFIKHAEELEENGIINTADSSQSRNEKFILSVKGEKQASDLSKIEELKNIDYLWSSSYVRAKQTAKYIAYENNIDINIDDRLCERRLGSLEDLSNWMKDKRYGVVQAYLLDKTYKGRDGESCNDATKRITEFVNEILEMYNGKRVAIVSHGAIISFLLSNWCILDKNVNLIWKDKKIEVKEPSVTKIVFEDKKLIDIIPINIDA